MESEKLETRNLRRGWAGGSASLSSPSRRIVGTHNDRLDRCLLSRAIYPYPTIYHLSVACSSRVPGHPSPSWSSLFGAEAREDRHLGAVKVVFCPQAHAGHFGRVVTATPLRLSSLIPGPRGSRGDTCRTLPRAGSVSASRIGLDRKGAHGRVYSDRGRPLTLRGSSQVRAAGAVGFQTRSGQQAARPVGSGSLVVRSRPPRPGSTSRTRGSPKGRPTPLPPGQSVCCCTLHKRADTGSFGQRVQTPLPVHGSFTVYMTGL